MTGDERAARRALACVTEAGEPRLSALLDRVGAVALWDMIVHSTLEDPWTARARRLDVAQVCRAEEAAGLRFVVPSDPEWPASLAALGPCPLVQGLAGAPVGLWLRGGGELAKVVASSVAIVGSRAASPYGERVAGDLAAGLAARNVATVSGGAFGIDAAAHRGCLAEGGLSVAVLAGGADDAYPSAHARLLTSIAERGLVVSEYPPGSAPKRHRFLARNRLIAALSQATVIVEAAARSGARNTVTWAGGCGRPVLAVPGPVSNATSFTPHRLIREGEAILATGVDDVLEAITPVGTVEQTRPRTAHLLDLLGDAERAVLETLPSRGALGAGEIALGAGLGMGACLEALDGVAARGLAERDNDGRWRRGPVNNRPLRAAEAVRADTSNGSGVPGEPTLLDDHG